MVSLDKRRQTVGTRFDMGTEAATCYQQRVSQFVGTARTSCGNIAWETFGNSGIILKRVPLENMVLLHGKDRKWSMRT